MISIIIPTYNEQDYIASLLTSISGNIGAEIEVIVVDGGSEDRTITIVEEFKLVKLIHSKKGRAIQMNRGAQISKGDILFFIHADSQLSNLWQEKILKALKDETYVAGSFHLQFDNSGFWYRLYGSLSKFKIRLFTYGDQGLFVHKSAFDQVSGYPILPIMEDYEILSRLNKIGKITKLDVAIITSTRKFVKNGVVLQQFKNVIIVTLYIIGISPRFLARWYR